MATPITANEFSLRFFVGLNDNRGLSEGRERDERQLVGSLNWFHFTPFSVKSEAKNHKGHSGPEPQKKIFGAKC